MQIALPCLFIMATVVAAPEENYTGSSLPLAFRPDIFSYNLQYRTAIDLNGPWKFRRDPKSDGVSNGWHQGLASSEGDVIVPGAPQAQGYGEPHAHQRTYFMEPFWLWRTFQVPALAERERVWFRLGGVLPAAELYINGEFVGYTRSSRTQQRIDISRFVQTGENLAAINVCDPPDVRLDGLLEWNEGNTHWSGPYRPIYCEIADRTMTIDAYLQPNLAERALEYTIHLAEPAESRVSVELAVTDGENAVRVEMVEIREGQEGVTGKIPLENYTTWSPEHPKLYLLEITLRDTSSGATRDRCGIRFGMREVRTEGNKIYLNGRPIFWNVYGEDMYFPETLSPPADKAWYLPRLLRARAYGMNGVKGCVETIPQEYIEAADEAGILIIQEMPFGLSTLRANRYTIDDTFKQFYAGELDGLVRVSRNHPSVVAYSMSSELEFSNQTQTSFDFFSRDLPQQTRELAPHALVIDCTGYVNTLETEKGRREADFYASIHPQWRKEVLEEADMISDGKRPLILHEYNWWSCYPDLGDRERYRDAQALPYWLETIEETAAKNGQTELLPIYRRNSLWLQAIARKDGIEYARRNSGVEGYILWLLIDFGHWSEGLLNDFWEPKNVSPEEFLQSNGPTVVLLAKEGDRTLRMGEDQCVPLGVSHYGAAEYRNAQLLWNVRLANHVIQHGALTVSRLIEGEFNDAGPATFTLPVNDTAYKVDLDVQLVDRDGSEINTNAWSFWAFPDTPESAAETTDSVRASSTVLGDVFLRIRESNTAAIPGGIAVVVADTVDDELLAYIESGGKCLLLSREAVIENRTPYYGETTFYGLYRTIPWNAGSAGNMGTVVANHPSMREIPHDGFCDLYWVWMLRGFYPMEFEPLRQYGVEPIIRNIDSHRANRNNAFMIEFNVGAGRVLATTLGILPNLKERVEAQYLFDCLLRYVRSDEFQPRAGVPGDDFVRLFSQKPNAVQESALAK